MVGIALWQQIVKSNFQVSNILSNDYIINNWQISKSDFDQWVTFSVLVCRLHWRLEAVCTHRSLLSPLRTEEIVERCQNRVQNKSSREWWRPCLYPRQVKVPISHLPNAFFWILWKLRCHWPLQWQGDQQVCVSACPWPRLGRRSPEYRPRLAVDWRLEMGVWELGAGAARQRGGVGGRGLLGDQLQEERKMEWLATEWTRSLD